MSCGDDDVSNCTVQIFNQTVNNEITALNIAIETFNMDPSEANCDAIREAAQSYLVAVDDLSGCPEVSQADFDLALDNAQEAVDTLMC